MRYISKKLLLILVLYLFININFYSFSEENRNIDIISDNFNMNINESTMVFKKNVRIKYKQFESFCDKAEVKINKDNGKVIKIIMSGKVKITRDNSQILGEKVTFEPETGKLSVEGNVNTKIKLNK